MPYVETYWILDAAAILVTGGHNTLDVSGVVLRAVEVLHSDGSPWCSLPDLPEDRRSHTQTGLEACGGYGYDPSFTCVRLEAGSWTPSHQLVEQRFHLSWASPAGTLLMGGFLSPQTTELLDANTGDSVTSFPLIYRTE